MENNNPPQTTAPLAGQKLAVTFNHSLFVKLDDKNFLLWQQQVMVAINGHDLTRSVVPERSSAEFQAWHKQDQLLLSWLLSSMSKSILTRVVGCKHSHEVWKRISKYFATHTRAKVHQYRTELRNIKKGTRTIAEYLLRIKALVDALISISSEVSKSEHVEIVLEGLSSEYDAFSTAIRMRKDPYTVSEIESLLLAQEALADSAKQITIETPSVNLTTLSKDKNTNGEKNSNNGNTRGNNQYFRGGRRGFQRSRGRGRLQSSYQGSIPFITCQVCHKNGHSAAECYHRFDQNYQPAVHFQAFPQQQQPNTGNMNNNMSALMAYSGYTYDNGWFSDSRATNHVTADSNNLLQGTEYGGMDQLHVGN